MPLGIGIGISPTLGQGVGVAPNIFYDPVGGNDGNDGLSASTPKKTAAAAIALIDATHRNLGCKAGTVGRDGSGVDWTAANCNILTYGSGAKFRFSGGALVTGWTQDALAAVGSDTYEGTVVDTYFNSTSGTYSLSASNPIVGTKSLLIAGANVQIGRSGGIGGNTPEIKGKLRSNSFSGSNTNFGRLAFFEGGTWNNANGVAMGIVRTAGATYIGLSRGGGSITSPQAYVIADGETIDFRFVVTANNGAGNARADLYINGSLFTSLTGLTLGGPNDSNAWHGCAAFQSTAFNVSFDSIGYYNTDSTGASGIWSAALTTQPYVLTYDALVRGTLVASKAAIATVGDWFWGSNSISMKSATDPATRSAEAAQRTKVLDLGTTSNVNIKNVQFSHMNNLSACLSVSYGASGGVWDGVEFLCNRHSGGFNQSAGAIVRNWLSRDNGSGSAGIGLDIDSGANITVQDFTCTNDIGGGVYAGALTPTIANFIIQRGTITMTPAKLIANGLLVDNCSSGLVDTVTVSGCQYNGFYVKGNSAGAANVTLRNCQSSGIFNGDGFHLHKDAAGAVTGIVIEATCSDSGSFNDLHIEGTVSYTNNSAMTP